MRQSILSWLTISLAQAFGPLRIWQQGVIDGAYQDLEGAPFAYVEDIDNFHILYHYCDADGRALRTPYIPLSKGKLNTKQQADIVAHARLPYVPLRTRRNSGDQSGKKAEASLPPHQSEEEEEEEELELSSDPHDLPPLKAHKKAPHKRADAGPSNPPPVAKAKRKPIGAARASSQSPGRPDQRRRTLFADPPNAAPDNNGGKDQQMVPFPVEDPSPTTTTRPVRTSARPATRRRPLPRRRPR